MRIRTRPSRRPGSRTAFPLARNRPHRYRSAITTRLPSLVRLPPRAVLLGPVSALAAAAPPAAEPESPSSWLLTVLNLLAVACFILWWLWMRRRGPAATADALALAPYDPAADAEWRARALAAEARADKAAALLKARLLPQLARWMMTELVQKLVQQRSGFAASQQQAEAEVAELEQRLEQLQAPLAERLRAYEQRIAELERQLTLQGEQNRELLRATIATARKKLQAERERSPLTWN